MSIDTYPSGKKVSRGDLVWWNGGKSIGVIVSIYDKSMAHNILGLRKECVMISNSISLGVDNNDGIIYDFDNFIEDGIEKLTDSVKDEIISIFATMKERYNVNNLQIEYRKIPPRWIVRGIDWNKDRTIEFPAS